MRLTSFGPPGIEPGLHPPHGRVLPAYSGPLLLLFLVFFTFDFFSILKPRTEFFIIPADPAMRKHLNTEELGTYEEEPSAWGERRKERQKPEHDEERSNNFL